MTIDLFMYFPAHYRRLHGTVGEVWLEYHDKMVIEIEAGTMKRSLTTLTGRVADQAAL
jgi:hypothetical protein